MDTKLRELYYSEWKDNPGKNPWELKGLCLKDQNLIVGKNAVGKSRTIRLITNLANIVTLKAPLLNGNWIVKFDVSEGNKIVKLIYELEIADKKVTKEIIKMNEDTKLKRNAVTKIYSENKKDYIDIDPPENKLVLHIRRDKTEFPFLEHLISWAENLRSYAFVDKPPNAIDIPKDDISFATLNSVPTVLDRLSKESLSQVILDMKNIGFEIENIQTFLVQVQPINFKMIQIKEKGLNLFINQPDISSGMFRAFALLVILEYLLNQQITSTILVDDLGEGLDYERATKLSELIFEKTKKTSIQFIASTNDSFLMNSISMKYWNILRRDGGIVSAYNFENNRKIFDEFKTTGLSNFDIFSSNLLSKLVIK